MSVPAGSAVGLPPVTVAGLPASVPNTAPWTAVAVNSGITARVPPKTTAPAAVLLPSVTVSPAWAAVPAGAVVVASSAPERRS